MSWNRHGHTRQGWQSPTYTTWRSMLKRCNDPKNKAYCRYGAVGIRVCARWSNFDNFLADMGERPPGKTIDRKDGASGYEPSNCRWATSREQGFNKICTVLSLESRALMAQKAQSMGSKAAAARWAVAEFGCAYRSAYNALMPKKQAADDQLREQLSRELTDQARSESLGG